MGGAQPTRKGDPAPAPAGAGSTFRTCFILLCGEYLFGGYPILVHQAIPLPPHTTISEVMNDVNWAEKKWHTTFQFPGMVSNL
jgi:hypothetical protein